MPGEVLDGVLPFAKRIIGGRFEYPGAMRNRARVVTIDVFDTHHHGVGIFAGATALFSDSDRAAVDVQLCPVILRSAASG